MNGLSLAADRPPLLVWRARRSRQRSSSRQANAGKPRGAEGAARVACGLVAEAERDLYRRQIRPGSTPFSSRVGERSIRDQCALLVAGDRTLRRWQSRTADLAPRDLSGRGRSGRQAAPAPAPPRAGPSGGSPAGRRRGRDPAVTAREQPRSRQPPSPRRRCRRRPTTPLPVAIAGLGSSGPFGKGASSSGAKAALSCIIAK